MRTYPQYEDSGVEWIGEIPTSWSYGSMKYQLSNNDGGVWGSDIDNEEDGTIVIRSTEITIDGKWDLTNPMKRRLSDPEIEKTLLNSGDIVLTKSSGSPDHIGKSVIVDEEVKNLRCCFSNFVQRLRFKNYSPKLYHYILNSYLVREQYRFLTKSTTGLGNLNNTTLNEIILPFIPLHEQKQISDYLDRKTQQIDDLIEKTERKIVLLKEQRSSLINQCVTKGLDPNVEMKDSGVEWIGEIPKEWDVSKIRYITEDHRQGYYSSNEYDDEGFRLVRITDIQDDHSINVNSSPFYDLTEEEISNFIVRDGDFLFPRTGGVGRFGIVDFDVPSIYGSFLIRFRFNKLISRDLLKYFFDSQLYLNQVLMEIHGGVNQNVHVENIKSCSVLVPPLPEQKQISDYLDRETSKIDRMVDTESNRTELLKEYRQSLISNVVTGKVDIRDEVIQ